MACSKECETAIATANAARNDWETAWIKKDNELKQLKTNSAETGRRIVALIDAMHGMDKYDGIRMVRELATMLGEE